MLDLNKIYKIDAEAGLKKISDNSVDCIVTSPPYYGLRNYGVDGQIGHEETLEEYLIRLTNISKECYRILKPSGIFFLNIGDSYANYKDAKSNKQKIIDDDRHILDVGQSPTRNAKILKDQGFKNKELMNVPYRLLFRLIDLGFYHRQTIIWAKATSGDERNGSCMPESVQDRFTQAYEPIFMLTKNDRYHFDSFAVKENLSNSTFSRESRKFDTVKYDNFANRSNSYLEIGANMRNVWRINLQPGSSGKHIAGFPEKIPEYCIKVAASAGGCCNICGVPYIRVLNDAGYQLQSWAPNTRNVEWREEKFGRMDKLGKSSSLLTDLVKVKTHSHFQKNCKCDTDQIKRPLVVDPFMGSGTTAYMALKLNCDFIGFDINQEYIDFANERIKLVNTKNKMF